MSQESVVAALDGVFDFSLLTGAAGVFVDVVSESALVAEAAPSSECLESDEATGSEVLSDDADFDEPPDRLSVL